MTQFKPEPCAVCGETIEQGEMRHSLFPDRHFRCAKDEREYNFLERHYISWRLSGDPLARDASAKGCYAAYNDIEPDTMSTLEEAWQHFKKFHPELEMGMFMVDDNLTCVCSECGHEQSTMDPCPRCKSVRVVKISVLVETFGENWRDAFKKPVESAQDDSIELRMKVWTGPDGKRWLVGGAMTSEQAMRFGRPMHAYAMRDAEVQMIELTHEEYNALPYSVFVETDRNAPSPGSRTTDKVRL